MRPFGCGVVLVLLVAAAPRARAQTETETPQLWQPDQAVAFLLGMPPAPRAVDPDAARPWDGSLGGGVTRTLFGMYWVVFSSQDLPVCGFSPSCSRFSRKAINHCGFVQGALLSLDRLLRDHPMAGAFYPRAEDGHLLKDDPARYCLTALE